MKFRSRREPATVAFQIAPMVDILLVLLCFFVITWSMARKENELDVRVPAASAGQESNPVVNQTVLNVKADGTVVWDRKTISKPLLQDKLKSLAALYPDYAIILRGDVKTDYEHIVQVLDTCRMAGIWNVAFATSKAE
ncbi:MAG: biopolymer transport protein ExbD [Verrucomicrobia bacterium]|nr:MAG: biopolymer transport protein ExbD [Verrucomicrobiota bacterium]